MSRAAFITRAGIAAGSVYGLSAVGPFVSRALAADGDLGILRYALTLEHIETAFYTHALRHTPHLKGTERKLARTLREHEQAHVEALRGAIKTAGGRPAAAPPVKFGAAFASVESFFETAQALEELGVSAYNGAAPLISSKDILSTAGAIVGVEARHAATIRVLRGQPITPGAFDIPWSSADVLAAVKPYLA